MRSKYCVLFDLNSQHTGVYFTDISSHAGSYSCDVVPDHEERGLLLLAEVALGEKDVKTAYDQKAHNLPEGKNSVWLMSTMYFPFHEIMMNGLLEMPDSHYVKRDIESEVDCDEYVVYNNAQIRLRYLLEIIYYDTRRI